MLGHLARAARRHVPQLEERAGGGAAKIILGHCEIEVVL